MEFFEVSYRVLDSLNALFQEKKNFNMGKIPLKYFYSRHSSSYVSLTTESLQVTYVKKFKFRPFI